MTASDWPLRVGEVSHWYSGSGLPPPRPPLAGDVSADVCIIGAGYTGLWAAHYLKTADPTLRIQIVEAEFAGFGASGRNGGWMTGGFAWNHARYLKGSTPEALRAMVRAMNGTVSEIIAITDKAGIDADIRLTDEVLLATNQGQLARLKAEIATRQFWGESGVRALTATEATARVFVPGTVGGMLVPGVARIQPAKLVLGLARMVTAQGVALAEKTRALQIRPGSVQTTQGTVTARHILRATEGFTAGISGHHRDWLPLNSAQIVTAPLPESVWQKIGWQGYEILGDFANSYCYCQRTEDGRIAVGGRGIPYRFGSQIDDTGAPDRETIRRLIAILHRHFPAARGHGIDHAWCGVLGASRDWCATVSYDPATGIGAAGGYVGVGVSTSNLAGRTLADLVLGRTTPLTTLPWVNRTVRKWEPEPLRWLGLRGMYRLYAAADAREARTNRPSALAGLANWIAGR